MLHWIALVNGIAFFRETCMKTFAIVLLLAALAVPASAAVIWNEGSNGDLSSNEAAPTPISFGVGSNQIIGSVSGSPLDRDYITFTIGAGQTLAHVNLIAFSPDNIAFTAFNSGSTSFIPSGATNSLFLSGIHITAADVGFDLMTFFDTRNVTTNSLPSPSLGPGTYCWMIQQTSPLLQSYTVEFVIDGALQTDPKTWGMVKAMYR
jgi:hypothetical protein